MISEVLFENINHVQITQGKLCIKYALYYLRDSQLFGYHIWQVLVSHTVASNTVWPEFEMITDNESEFSTEMSEENGSANALVSKDKTGDTMKSLLDNFEV